MPDHVVTIGQHIANMHLTEKASYVGALVSFVTGLSLNELGVLFGIILGIATFVVNWWFQWRRDTREERALRKARRNG